MCLRRAAPCHAVGLLLPRQEQQLRGWPFSLEEDVTRRRNRGRWRANLRRGRLCEGVAHDTVAKFCPARMPVELAARATFIGACLAPLRKARLDSADFNRRAHQPQPNIHTHARNNHHSRYVQRQTAQRRAERRHAASIA